jgi:predicted RNase H-like HicB family nuclease
MQHYTIVVFWSEEDSAWIADVPDLKSCSAFGSSPEEAVAEVRITMEAWLGSARDARFPVPEPSYRPQHEAAVTEKVVEVHLHEADDRQLARGRHVELSRLRRSQCGDHPAHCRSVRPCVPARDIAPLFRRT